MTATVSERKRSLLMLNIIRRFSRLSAREQDWLRGAGLAFDPLPVLRYHTFSRSDRNAIRADWEAVGADLRKAMHVIVSRNWAGELALSARSKIDSFDEIGDLGAETRRFERAKSTGSIRTG